MNAAAAAEAAARGSYGRLLAWLAWQWRDVAAAEDALADAFAAALERWPVDGVPAAPDAWLLTAAKRRLLMAARRQRLADDPTLTVLWPDEHAAAPDAAPLPDVRLRLLFVCAHPAIDAGLHSALMLQTVLGLDAARIASAFLVKPEAMTKRLVRAKAKIRDAGLRFEEPGPDEWPERLASVLEAIYGAYTLHWGLADDADAGELAGEARFLAELVASQLPDEPEALGLVALLWLCEARRAARGAAFRPLHEQDPRDWDAGLIAQADAALRRAATHRAPGPFQLEAAIQAAHTQGRVHGRVPWDGITRLHERLLEIAPTVGARIAHAVALGHALPDPAAGLRLLDAIEAERVSTHQPWWAARAHLLAMAGSHAEAAAAYGRALALTVEPRLRAWMTEHVQAEDAAAAPEGPGSAPTRSPGTP
ncbi:MAG: RNA polymerase sigma factor [Vitreoscilla sp.]